MTVPSSGVYYRFIVFVSTGLLIFSSGCANEIVSGSMPDSQDAGVAELSIISLRDNYVVQRFDRKTVVVSIQALFQNRSDQDVYLAANVGNVLFRFHRLVDEDWEYISTGQTGLRCGGCDKPVVVLSGEELKFERPIGSSFAETQDGDRWGRDNVSGTYRAGVIIYLIYDSSPAALAENLSGILSERVPDELSFTSEFQLIDLAEGKREKSRAIELN